MAEEKAAEQPSLGIKAEEYITNAVSKAVGADAAFSFALILSIITALAPVLTGCLGNARRMRKSIKEGNGTFLLANFRAAHEKGGLTPGESAAYALEMRVQCAKATDDEIDEFVSMCVESAP